jgi:Holliday junction resolvasome RuvABC endonuclease subunit
MAFFYGFDLSLAQSGVSICDENGNFVDIFSIPTSDRLSCGKRLKVIADTILEKKEKYPCDTIILERAFSRFNVATAALYRVHGIVNYIWSDAEQIYYTPKTIKAALLKGDATKKQIREIIENKYGIITSNEDESDACAVLLTYLIKKGIK